MEIGTTAVMVGSDNIWYFGRNFQNSVDLAPPQSGQLLKHERSYRKVSTRALKVRVLMGLSEDDFQAEYTECKPRWQRCVDGEQE